MQYLGDVKAKVVKKKMASKKEALPQLVEQGRASPLQKFKEEELDITANNWDMLNQERPDLFALKVYDSKNDKLSFEFNNSAIFNFSTTGILLSLCAIGAGASAYLAMGSAFMSGAGLLMFAASLVGACVWAFKTFTQTQDGEKTIKRFAAGMASVPLAAGLLAAVTNLIVYNDLPSFNLSYQMMGGFNAWLDRFSSLSLGSAGLLGATYFFISAFNAVLSTDKKKKKQVETLINSRRGAEFLNVAGRNFARVISSLSGWAMVGMGAWYVGHIAPNFVMNFTETFNGASGYATSTLMWLPPALVAVAMTTLNLFKNTEFETSISATLKQWAKSGAIVKSASQAVTGKAFWMTTTAMGAIGALGFGAEHMLEEYASTWHDAIERNALEGEEFKQVARVFRIFLFLNIVSAFRISQGFQTYIATKSKHVQDQFKALFKNETKESFFENLEQLPGQMAIFVSTMIQNLFNTEFDTNRAEQDLEDKKKKDTEFKKTEEYLDQQLPFYKKLMLSMGLLQASGTTMERHQQELAEFSGLNTSVFSQDQRDRAGAEYHKSLDKKSADPNNIFQKIWPMKWIFKTHTSLSRPLADHLMEEKGIEGIVTRQNLEPEKAFLYNNKPREYVRGMLKNFHLMPLRGEMATRVPLSVAMFAPWLLGFQTTFPIVGFILAGYFLVNLVRGLAKTKINRDQRISVIETLRALKKERKSVPKEDKVKRKSLTKEIKTLIKEQKFLKNEQDKGRRLYQRASIAGFAAGALGMLNILNQHGTSNITANSLMEQLSELIGASGMVEKVIEGVGTALDSVLGADAYLWYLWAIPTAIWAVPNFLNRNNAIARVYPFFQNDGLYFSEEVKKKSAKLSEGEEKAIMRQQAMSMDQNLNR